MILTIRFVEETESKNPAVLALCNLEIKANDKEAVKDSYQKLIPKVHNQNFSGNATMLLQEVTALVMSENPDMILMSVNDDPRKCSKTHFLDVKLTRKTNNPYTS